MHAIYRHNIHLKDCIHGYCLQSIKPPHFSENPEPHDQADAHEHAQNNDYLFFRTFFHTLVIKFVLTHLHCFQHYNIKNFSREIVPLPLIYNAKLWLHTGKYLSRFSRSVLSRWEVVTQ